MIRSSPNWRTCFLVAAMLVVVALSATASLAAVLTLTGVGIIDPANTSNFYVTGYPGSTVTPAVFMFEFGPGRVGTSGFVAVVTYNTASKTYVGTLPGWVIDPQMPNPAWTVVGVEAPAGTITITGLANGGANLPNGPVAGEALAVMQFVEKNNVGTSNLLCTSFTFTDAGGPDTPAAIVGYPGYPAGIGQPSRNIIVAHTVTASASADPTTVASSGTTTLTGGATDTIGGHTFTWSWSDGGAGGSFAPNNTTQSPTYTAPANKTGSDIVVTLTLTATCNGSPAASDDATVDLTVNSLPHTVTATASCLPTTVKSGGDTDLTGGATDSWDHGIATWSWSDGGAGGSFAPDNTTQSPTYTAPANTSGSDVTVTLTLTATCDDASPVSDDGVCDLTVASTVTCDAGPDKEIGTPGSTTLDATVSGGKAPFTYSWLPITGLDDASILQPTASPTVTTLYTLDVTDSLGQTAPSDSMTVTVYSAVTAEAGADKSISLGGSTTLDGSASGGKTPYTWLWSPASGLDDNTAQVPNASPAVTTLYTLTATDALGQIATDSATVTVGRTVSLPAVGNLPGQLVVPTLSIDDANGVAAFLAVVIYNPAVKTYIGVAADPALPLGWVVIGAEAPLGTITITGTAAPGPGLPAGPIDLADITFMEGMGGACPLLLGPVTLADNLGAPIGPVNTVNGLNTVGPPPAVTAEAGPDKIIALGGSCILQGSAGGGVGGPYTYSWAPPETLDNANIAGPTATPTVTTLYTLTVTDALSTPGTDTATVTVAPPVVAEAGPDKGPVVSGDPVTLEGSASSGQPGYTYSWTPTAGLSDPTKAQPTATCTATTVYTLEVTDSLGQTDTDDMTVTVASAVVADAGADQTIGSGDNVVLGGSPTASGGVGPYTYAWTIPPSPTVISTDANPSVSPTADTTYEVAVTDSLAQTATDTVTITVVAQVFTDVSPTHPFVHQINAIYREGITGGCSLTPLMYCPTNPTTRGQMAVFLCRAAGLTELFSVTPRFTDVPDTHPFYGWIERLADPASWGGTPPTQGCTATEFCPAQNVTRGQMAAFLCRATGKTQLTPVTPTFSDVPTSHPFYGWIERLADLGSWPVPPTTGCAPGPPRLYCPTAAITRGQMAVFLCRAFNIPF